MQVFYYFSTFINCYEIQLELYQTYELQLEKLFDLIAPQLYQRLTAQAEKYTAI